MENKKSDPGEGKFPSGIPFIIGNEAAERFNFYGLKAILTTFLITQFFNPSNNPALQQMAEAQANEKTHLFNTLSYFLPIAGGLLADWFLGKYRTILWLSLIYCLGNAMLAGFVTNLQGFMTGLLLIACGAGGIKPCVSANVGDQFTESNKHLLTKAFSLFYFSINFGSFFSTLLIPLVQLHYGARVAFGIPGVLMLLATIIFYSGRKKYIRVPPSGPKKENFVAINIYALTHTSAKEKNKPLLDVALKKYPKPSVDAVKAVWRILAIFAFIPVFWALYDQNSSEWVLQATKLDLHIFGITLLAQQVQAVNPILILAFVPLFSFVLYPRLEKAGIAVTPLRKIAAGLILTALSFIIIFFLQVSIDHGGMPGVGWQILAYIILTAAEILISITGLEYAYTQAPASMKSTLTAFWLLTVSLGNLFVTMINSSISHQGFFSKLEGANYYLFFIGVITLFTIAFIFLSRRMKERQRAVGNRQ